MSTPSLMGPSLRTVKRILVVHARGGMGDVLLSTPVLEALQKRYKVPLDVLVRSGSAAMVERNPVVSEVMVAEEGDLDHTKTWSRWLNALKKREYSLAVVLWSKFPEASLVYRAGIRHRVGQDSRLMYSWMYTRRVRVRSEHGDTKSHWVECLMDYARAVNAELSDPMPRLFLDDAIRAQAAEILRGAGVDGPYSVLHVGRGTPLEGRMPTAPFARIGDAMASALGMPVVLTGGSAEIAIVESVASGMRERSVPLAGRLTVAQLGGVLEKAAVAVANDSGPMHMAAALDAPTVGLFAMEKDLPDRWGPRGKRAQLVRPASFRCSEECLKETCPQMVCYEDLAPEVVVEAARKAMEM
ncbi:MAG: glycosyltransferase family 9 protein [Armatimonadetes bacterium]|nr:glycosyltransferase family 9 protein [Armatimonadota bacterium]